MKRNWIALAAAGVMSLSLVSCSTLDKDEKKHETKARNWSEDRIEGEYGPNRRTAYDQINGKYWTGYDAYEYDRPLNRVGRDLKRAGRDLTREAREIVRDTQQKLDKNV